MTSIIIKLDSAKTTTEITRIMMENLKYFNGSTILDHVAHKARRRINKTRFCPVCGSDYLLKHDYVWIDGKYSECGIWHTYRDDWKTENTSVKMAMNSGRSTMKTLKELK